MRKIREVLRLEQFATIPLSQFEATGISGDVPFTVEFPGNAAAFVIPAPAPANSGPLTSELPPNSSQVPDTHGTSP